MRFNRRLILPLTISQFAKLLNLSPSTISKAINGYADVSQETRERVFIAIKEYGYQPIASARSLRLKKKQQNWCGKPYIYAGK